jgi:hypothetical protein
VRYYIAYGLYLFKAIDTYEKNYFQTINYQADSRICHPSGVLTTIGFTIKGTNKF